MSDTLTIGSLAAERGQKLRGWLPVPGTSIQLPLTLIHGARPGKILLVTGGSTAANTLALRRRSSLPARSIRPRSAAV